MTDPIYLDNNASTPLDPRVRQRLLEALDAGPGNPSSSHSKGQQLSSLIQRAREQVADLVGGGAGSTVFTSGATEANNLATMGLVEGNLTPRRRILMFAAEHASVLNVGRHLGHTGTAKVDVIRATSDGLIDLESLDELLADDVLVVSVMAANSETGVVNPIGDVVEAARRVGAFVHCDATQAIGRIPFHMSEFGVDLVTLSSHKIYGPQGVGALSISSQVRRHMVPIVHGGGHETGLRSGTENAAGIAAFGHAAELAGTEGIEDMARVAPLLEHLTASLQLAADGVVNGEDAPRLSNTANIWFAGADADAVLANMPTIAASSGSACSSGAPEPSPVLLAMGQDRTRASEAIRFSLGRYTTPEEVDRALPQIVSAVSRVRELSSRQ